MKIRAVCSEEKVPHGAAARGALHSPTLHWSTRGASSWNPHQLGTTLDQGRVSKNNSLGGDKIVFEKMRNKNIV